MYFMTKDNKLLNKYIKIWDKASNSTEKRI